jgi:hypothetical protein
MEKSPELKHVSQMTPEEYKAAVAEACKAKPRPPVSFDKHARDMTHAEYRAALAKCGVYIR